MGVVYRARDEKLKRRVAIKVLPPELAFQAEIRARFTREAETAARLSHPHIVPIYAVGEGNGLVYFVMGYVDGESLGGRLKRRGKLPVEEVRRIMKETADALSAAHALSVIHRDIKPDNILLDGTRGRVMVTDFGIAKAMSAGSGGTLTSAGVAIGTPQYMSPEQAAGEKEIDGRSDLYSLGIVSYQMLTGKLPFTAPSVAGILMKQITEMPPSISAERSDCPEDLALAVMRCLEKDPENRWPSADALRQALESRTVTNYRPTGRPGAASAANPAADLPDVSPRRSSGMNPQIPQSPPLGRRPLPQRPSQGRPVPSDDWRDRLDRHMDRASRRMERRSGGSDTPLPVPDTGEPKIVQKTRAQFARWAAVSAGCFMINIATGMNEPWFLFPTFFMGFGLANSYSRLWQAGTLAGRAEPAGRARCRCHPKWQGGQGGTRPSGAAGRRVRALHGPGDAGAHRPAGDPQAAGADVARGAEHAARGRARHGGKPVPAGHRPGQDALLHGHQHGPAEPGADRPADRGPEAGAGRRGARAADDAAGAAEEDHRRPAGPAGPHRQPARELHPGHAERALDLLRLRSADAAAALGDLTMATQQARALSRDVDNAIVAAAEIREALGKD
ncbi:MAG: protein kinase [Gemmatimonadetes bacterium]|nr:protein kinase [Gemmatimonadota bacterium]